MRRNLFACIALPLLSWSGSAQSPTPFKSYKTQEDYCRENPKMPTCINGRPIGDALEKTLYKPPAKTPSLGAGARGTSPSQVRPEMSPVTEVTLQDWRFSHPAPAMLISLNIGSLTRSPIWATLLPALGAGPEDIEKARVALSDVGQLLISVTANGTTNPSVLMLARGNVDGALSALLRSGSGMQARRLDAITMLIGDINSLEHANLRIRSKLERTTWNPLQQAATREALKYDAWIGVDPRHLASITSALGGGSNPGLAALAQMRGVSIGLYLREQIRMEALLDAASPDMAERMLAAYRQAEAKQGGKDPMGGQVWATIEGAKLRFIQIVEASRLRDVPGLDATTAKLIGSQIAPLIQALAGSGSRSASAAAPKPAQGAIVIQGLAGGPKELPV